MYSTLESLLIHINLKKSPATWKQGISHLSKQERNEMTSLQQWKNIKYRNNLTPQERAGRVTRKLQEYKNRKVGERPCGKCRMEIRTSAEKPRINKKRKEDKKRNKNKTTKPKNAAKENHIAMLQKYIPY